MSKRGLIEVNVPEIDILGAKAGPAAYSMRASVHPPQGLGLWVRA